MLEATHLLILGALLALGYLILLAKGDPREPPNGKSSIPIIGHPLGMMRHGMKYIPMVAKGCTDPIITLNFGFLKIYVVTSPDMMNAVQRQSKVFSFGPFLDFAAERLAGLTGKTLHAFRTVEAGGQGLVKTVMHASTPFLAGKSLDKLNRDMFSAIQPMIDELATKESVDLIEWVHYAMTLAGTRAAYGPMNPFEAQEVRDAFWEVDRNVSPLLMNFLPWLTARKAYTNRKIVLSAFIEYLNKKGQNQACDFILKRYQVLSEAGLSDPELAQNEASVPLALLSNTIPATFWVIYTIFSHPDLLQELREEVEQNAFKMVEGECVVDLKAIREDCPLLISTFHEIMRKGSNPASTRFVMSDFTLADKYHLKAGNVVILPSQVIGRHEKAWGPSADEFNPRRYLTPEPSDHPDDPKTVRRTGRFMAFGVSAPICPGRHFAASEILGLACMLMMRFDFTPEGVSGRLLSPILVLSWRPPGL
ncbi:cytochrome P450 [Penicillium chermesinum]|nr:cytochrome P450 [Penicillium chermesinum]